MLLAVTATLSLVLAIFAFATAVLAGAYAGGAHKRLDTLESASLSTFRSHLATIERERAERQRVDLEADMKGRG
jgi:hypothetical protein